MQLTNHLHEYALFQVRNLVSLPHLDAFGVSDEHSITLYGEHQISRAGQEQTQELQALKFHLYAHFVLQQF